MKKVSFLALSAPVFLVLASCVSTEKSAASPDNAIGLIQEETANSIADEMNAVSQKNNAEAKEEGTEENLEKNTPVFDTEKEARAHEAPQAEEIPETEKVSDEDLIIESENVRAPTTDERLKVPEAQIFEEPDVIVIDAPEEEEEAGIQNADFEDEAGGIEDKISEDGEIPEEFDKVLPNNEEDIDDFLENSAMETDNSSETGSEESESPSESAGEDDETVQILPSRSVSLKIGQYLDVSYPGKGWTYIGEPDKDSGKDGLLAYSMRRIGSADTTFSLLAKKAGDTTLHFYKNDVLLGEYIDDYLSVTVENERGAGRVRAPSYADIVPAQPQRKLDRAGGTPPQENDEVGPPAQNQKDSQEKEISREAVSKTAQPPSVQTEIPENRPSSPVSGAESDIKTVIHTADSQPGQAVSDGSEDGDQKKYDYSPVSSESARNNENGAVQDGDDPALDEPWKKDYTAVPQGESDESLLERAKKDFSDGKFEDALREAREYYDTASTRLDEALFLLGQISESNSQARNIRMALDSYDMLVENFPASKFWKQARNRSIYLRRFYIDIR